MLTTDGTWRAAASPAVRRSFTIGSTFVVLALGIFIVARRTTGEIVSPLPLVLLIPTVILLVAWGCFVRFWACDARASSFSFWSPLIAVFLVAIGLSFPRASVIDWLVWFAALVMLVLGPRWFNQTRRSFRVKLPKQRGNRLLQDLKRYRGAEGREFVRGTLTAELPPGQRIESLWVGFCPPFELLPKVMVHATGNSSASVKVAQVLHNGARLEIRLPHTAGCQQVTNIELVAAEPDAI